MISKRLRNQASLKSSCNTLLPHHKCVTQSRILLLKCTLDTRKQSAKDIHWMHFRSTYLHSYNSEKVKQKLTSKATVAKQLIFRSFAVLIKHILVPPTGFRINVIIVLPGFSKGGGRRIPCLPFWSDTRG